MKVGDLKCVQKPTRGQLSLTHLPVQPLSIVADILQAKCNFTPKMAVLRF